MKKTTQYMNRQKMPGYIKESDSEEQELEAVLLQIACELIQYRGTENLTQKQLAKELGTTPSMISRLESGDYSPTVRLLFEIAQRLGWRVKLEFGPEKKFCGNRARKAQSHSLSI